MTAAQAPVTDGEYDNREQDELRSLSDTELRDSEIAESSASVSNSDTGGVGAQDNESGQISAKDVATALRKVAFLSRGLGLASVRVVRLLADAVAQSNLPRELLEGLARLQSDPATLDSTAGDGRSDTGVGAKIRSALADGDVGHARELAAEYAHDDPAANKFWKVLAPPETKALESGNHDTVQSNHAWLSATENRREFDGKWVALNDGQLESHGDTLEAVLDQVGSNHDFLITRVLED